jgi:hypothetical protein
MLKSGLTRREIAKTFQVQTFTVEQICKGYPTTKIINKINNTENFKEWFTFLYNSSSDVGYIKNECLKHSFFIRIKKTSIHQRISEIRKLFNLPPKMFENNYTSKYDRIRGYIIRNTKFMSKRRNIVFNLHYTDFELPEYCPILNIKLEYGSGYNANSYNHATLDRIDNSKGYIKNNIMIISRLANAMKNEASFKQLEYFINNYTLLLNYINEQGALGNITDIFPHWKKLNLDS